MTLRACGPVSRSMPWSAPPTQAVGPRVPARAAVELAGLGCEVRVGVVLGADPQRRDAQPSGVGEQVGLGAEDALAREADDPVDLAWAAAGSGGHDGAPADRGAHEHHAPRAVGAQPARRGQHLVLAAGGCVVEDDRTHPVARDGAGVGQPAARAARALVGEHDAGRSAAAEDDGGQALAGRGHGDERDAGPRAQAVVERPPRRVASSRSWRTSCRTAAAAGDQRGDEHEGEAGPDEHAHASVSAPRHAGRGVPTTMSADRDRDP